MHRHAAHTHGLRRSPVRHRQKARGWRPCASHPEVRETPCHVTQEHVSERQDMTTTERRYVREAALNAQGEEGRGETDTFARFPQQSQTTPAAPRHRRHSRGSAASSTYQYEQLSKTRPRTCVTGTDTNEESSSGRPRTQRSMRTAPEKKKTETGSAPRTAPGLLPLSPDHGTRRAHARRNDAACEPTVVARSPARPPAVIDPLVVRRHHPPPSPDVPCPISIQQRRVERADIGAGADEQQHHNEQALEVEDRRHGGKRGMK